jgi:hypothetical protein
MLLAPIALAAFQMPVEGGLQRFCGCVTRDDLSRAGPESVMTEKGARC